MIAELLFLALAATPEKTALPDETLRYSVNWPSGLSLGESTLRAARSNSDTGDRWTIDLTLEASVPGYSVNDHYVSLAVGQDYCSAEFQRNYVHGKRKAEEKLTFDASKKVVVRETLHGGGKSEQPLSLCGRDPLAYIQFLRRELSQGRLPAQQTVIFGSAYTVRVEFTGTQQIRVGDSRVDADRLVASIKGPSTDANIELFFAKDPQRTPLLIRVPLSMGAFSMELVR